ncbi:fumarylacetoacetate hydrolase family protein [Nocardia africana]|uniref:Fumarylacetoacetate hydrolase family protein n=1 Tax=Nocardia africana TaxID=134964 RepID=A0ABW6NNU4_9NOCA
MAYATYETHGLRRVGVVDGDALIPLAGLSEIGSATTSQVLAEAPRLVADRTPIADVRLLPVVPRPAKIFCVGLNYREHVTETERELPTYPVLFPKFASSLVGANDDIVAPAESQQIDYEGELAVVIGRAGRRIAEADAADHILGYTVANDITMRDFQYKTHQWMQGKAWDASTPLGPYLVTPEEVDVSHAGIRTVVGGVTVQESDLSMLIFSIPTLIATISTFTALEPGDLILTGTPGGVGYRRDPQLFLGDGDQVSVEIDGVGVLRSTVRAEITASTTGAGR